MGVSLGARFEVSKVLTFPVSPLCLMLQDVSSKLLLQHHAFLTAAMLPAMTHGQYTSETISPE